MPQLGYKAHLSGTAQRAGIRMYILRIALMHVYTRIRMYSAALNSKSNVPELGESLARIYLRQRCAIPVSLSTPSLINVDKAEREHPSIWPVRRARALFPLTFFTMHTSLSEHYLLYFIRLDAIIFSSSVCLHYLYHILHQLYLTYSNNITLAGYSQRARWDRSFEVNFPDNADERE